MVVSYIHAVRSHDGDNDEGSISPLIVGMCALVLLIASVTLAVTGAHVQTHRLEDLADAQAISIARTIEHGFSEYSDNSADNARARQLAAKYLEESGASHEFVNLQVDSVQISDDRTVHVTLRARIHPPIVSAVVSDGFEVKAQARARIHQQQKDEK